MGEGRGSFGAFWRGWRLSLFVVYSSISAHGRAQGQMTSVLEGRYCGSSHLGSSIVALSICESQS